MGEDNEHGFDLRGEIKLKHVDPVDGEKDCTVVETLVHDGMEEGYFYLIEGITRDCIDEVVGLFKNGGVEVDLKGFSYTEELYPPKDFIGARMVVCTEVPMEEFGEEVLFDEKVDLGRRAFIGSKMRLMIDTVVTQVQEVFRANPGVNEVCVLLEDE
jgi:hypothetical protein